MSNRLSLLVRGTARPSPRLPWTPVQVFVFVAILAGIGLRLWVLLSPHMSAMDQDESVAGLMARHFAEGEFAPFFWGQPYGGTFEILVSSGLFRLFGPSLMLMRLVAIGLHALGAWLTWRVGRRVLDTNMAAIAAALVWIWPTYAVWRSVRAHTFYATSLVLVLLVMLMALRMAKEPRVRDALILGLAVGLGVWISPQTVFAFIPIGFWLVYKNPRALRLTGFIIPAAIAGAFPFVWANSFGNSQSFSGLATVGSPSEYFSTLTGLFAQPIPSALSIRVPGSPNWAISPVVGPLLYSALLVGFVWVFRRTRGSPSLLWTTLIGFILLLSFSEHASYRAEPRYLYIVMPILALLVAQLATEIRLPVLIPILLLGLSFLGLYAISQFPRDTLVPADFSPVVSALESHDITHAFAYHRIAYRLSFESDEEVIATPIDHNRYEPFNTAVRASSNPSYVFAPQPEVSMAFQAELDRRGISHSVLNAGDFDVVTPDEATTPEQFESLTP